MTKILVLGGTGLLGEPVSRRLVTDGFQVRVLSRDPQSASAALGAQIDVVAGDVADVDSLERALDGCQAVHISVGGAVDQLSAENVVALASKCGLERIGYVSGSTVSEENRWFPMVEQKLNAEAVIADCGVPYTVFCPTWPMEQLPRFARGGSPTLIGRQPTPLHWFAAQDMARMVSTAYQTEEAINKRFFIHGPEPMTFRAALERYCGACHPDFGKVSVMPIWLAKLMGTLTRNEMLKYASDLMAYFEKVGELGDPAEANRLLGAPTTTLDAWIAQRKASQEEPQEEPTS